MQPGRQPDKQPGKQRILIIGACGAIGQNLRPYLIARGYEVVGLDIMPGADIQADIRMSIKAPEKPIDIVIHLAALIDVGASMSDPAAYYDTNVLGTINVLKWMHQHHITRLIFSSTAAVYGDASTSEPLVESAPTNPTSVYGRSKLICEQIITDFATTYNWQVVILRTFNVAGMLDLAPPAPLRHLIPIFVNAFITAKQSHLPPTLIVNGKNFTTCDGTAERDYIDISDVCEAFYLSAIAFAGNNSKIDIYNIGSGHGTTVLEIIQALTNITHIEPIIVYQPPRAGDPATYVANSNNAHTKLNWAAKYHIQDIINHTWIAYKN